MSILQSALKPAIRAGYSEVRLGNWLVNSGTHLLRYGLVFLLLLIGGTKFTQFEAEAIRPLVENSPFLSWMYRVADYRTTSAMIGVIELVIGVLIALRPFARRISGYGSLAAVGMFLTTLSFLFTTPGALEPGNAAGGFLMKDLILLGAAVFTAGEALQQKK
jgi:uncharacterized membrane protein YkgB